MATEIQVALITAGFLAATTLLIAIVRGVWVVVTMIIDTYKQQAEATVAAKDRDLAAKDREIGRLQHEVTSALSDIQAELRWIRQELGR